MSKKYIVIIPARKGSKRLINKNTKILNHLSLLEHTIQFSKKIENVSEIILTSDIDNTESLCNKYKIKFSRRKKELATDTTSTLEVLKYIINENSYRNVSIILLQPTSPIRSIETINNMIQIFEKKCDTVVTVKELNNPRIGKFVNQIYLPLNYKVGKRSQDIEKLYEENGNIYILNSDTILKNCLYMNNLYGYEINENEGIDIDTENDFILANKIVRNKQLSKINSIEINKKRKIGPNEKCFIIAEACDNHIGKMEYALKMVNIAYLCGADAVKFQHHLPDEEMLQNVPMSSNFSEPLYEILQKYSLSLEQHKELKSYCDKLGIIYMCTPFSKKAADEIEDLVDIYKIGSGELTDHPTLIEIAKKGKPMIISTGMSNIDEIEETLNILRPINNNIMILNCTSEYPPNYKDINLKLIPKLMERFGIIVGHSDHTPDNYTCFGAVSCGAKIVEKHFILDKLIPGPDQNVSIDPHGLADLVEGIRKIEVALGDTKTVHDLEKPIKSWARRSIVTIKDIKKGDKFTLKNLWGKRPGTGIPSKYLFDILGKKAYEDINKDILLPKLYNNTT